MKKLLLFSAMTFGALAAAAAPADYLKVTYHDKEVANGETIVINDFKDDDPTGMGYNNHADYIYVENISTENLALSWKSEYTDTPTWADAKANPKKYGAFTLCIDMCFSPDNNTGIIDKVFTDFTAGKKAEIQEHLQWPDGGYDADFIWEDYNYTPEDIAEIKASKQVIKLTLCPMKGDSKIEGAEMTINMQFGPAENAAVAGIEAETEGTPVYYNLQGVRVENPGDGLYIVRQGNSVKKVIL